MRMSTPQQRGAIGAMVARMKMSKDSKEALVYSFSGERTTTTTGLYFEEASELIKHLKLELNLGDTPKDKMTNKILSIAHELGWKVKGKVDIQRVNAWCVKYGQYSKPLDDHTEKELPSLVTQFEQVQKHHLMGI